MIEKWKTVQEYPTYEVSNFGVVRSLEAKMFKGTELRTISKKEVKPYNISGTARVMLYKLHELYELKLNILVMKAFGDAHRKMRLEHKDGNFFNCSFDNLKFK
jgi:hypothetical protein